MEAYRFNPSERTATTIAEFLEACQSEPMVAADHLQDGYFEPWLRDSGRRDLAEAAAQIRVSDVPSAEGLQQFVQTAVEGEGQSRSRPRSAPRRMPTKPAPSKARARKDPDR
jgi:hypothetical protein